MCDFKINYDLRPYLPDLNIKTNIYNTLDSVNNNLNINVNLTIFIFNINRPINSIYNDPNYLLFGIKNPQYLNDYEFPSLNFFSSNENLSNDYSNYRVEYISNKLTNESRQLLNSIGYDLSNIDDKNLTFQILVLKENITSIEHTILYFYFNFKIYKLGQDIINYNNYENITYYNNKNNNVLIYPFLNNEFNKYKQSLIKKYIYERVEVFNSSKSIKNINFDNREIIKYYEKIDYKYFENKEFTMDEKTNIETLKNYTFNIKNYVQYINNDSNKNDQVINISLNEISKMFFYSTDYNSNNEKTYTLVKLNNLHLNNNNIFSNQNNRYSYTMDKKIANINRGDQNSKNYSMYYYNTNIFESSLYQQILNYHLNFYYNISDANSINQMSKLNKLLYKIFLLINPKIIDLNYLINNVSTKIQELFEDSNNLQFSNDVEKLELYILGNIKQTKIYYINKYKIEIEFIDNLSKKTFVYIIILNISFYNNSFFYIENLDETSNTPLAYVNYTVIEESISLLPSIYIIQNENYLNKSDGKIFFYNTMNSFTNDSTTKNYYWNINYSGKDALKQSSDFISVFNFYDIIPNMIANLKTINGKYYNNVINILKTKINNYINNFINVENNYSSYTHYINNIKKYINFTTLYDKTIITDHTNVKYIEYYEYFPKISNEFLNISKNYIGKYSQILIYPYNKENISSFEILPSGKYIKFNYINYSSLHYPSVEIEEFVKSIKTINSISNYYFSLFIKLPYNINQDDEFYCLYNEYLINSTYSMGIGGCCTSFYLVLTDQNSNPYNFYSNEEFNGIIFGIKLYNYNNFISKNLKLQLIPNLYMTQYMNLNEFIIMMENFSDYSDSNNVLWDINKTFLKTHNFDSLKEIILFDYKRFNSQENIEKIKINYDKFNYKILQIIADNKIQLNYLRYDIKILIYLSNLFKIIKLIQKIYSYFEIIKVNIMLGKFNNNNYLIGIIRYNCLEISNLFQINYNFLITSGNFETKIYENISKMCEITDNITLEKIDSFQTYCIYILNYSINKIPSLTELINFNVSETNNLYHNLYYKIFKQIIIENINFLIGEEIIYDIDNFISNVSIEVFNGFNKFNSFEKQLLLKQINAFLKSLIFNTTKIYELYNLAKLMGFEEIDGIIKNTYIYNTNCYTSNTNIPKFKIIDFLHNTIELINKLSNPLLNPEFELYQKSINQGIITFANNTIDYFKLIIEKIIQIYDKIIDIYDRTQISNFYNLLKLFEDNYKGFFNILFQNKIDKFYEYAILIELFNNLFYSCEEFLLYVCLRNTFINEITLFESENIFIDEDLYKIIKNNIFYDFTIKTIENIDNLVISKDPKLTIIYLEKIKSKFEMKVKTYVNQQTINIIDEMIIELNNSLIPNDYISYGSYYIIPYQDLLLLKGSFDWASFNFKKEIANLIQNVNSLNISIYESYFLNPEITSFYSNALNYSYLSTPYKYININNKNDFIN